MSVKKDVEEFLISDEVERVADYAKRGRKHQRMTDEELSTAWKVAFTHMADNIRDNQRRAVTNDFDAEFSLQGQEPPYDSVREIFERYTADVCRDIKNMEVDDPDQYDEMGDRIVADMNAFKISKDKSN